MKPLDFLVIGAQKSGTTSLFKYLNEHPQIYLPPSKEVPFFTQENYGASSWDETASIYYSDAPDNHLWGAVSPQYMTTSKACYRIKASMPNVRLVAILRNPIDRAFSHYLMMRKRGLESRTFSEAIAVQIKSAQASDEEKNNYLRWGRYGEILQHYFNEFSSESILVGFTEELKSNPQEVYDKTLAHIGIIGGYEPSNIGEIFHRGSDSRIIPDSWKSFVGRLWPVRVVWGLFPQSTRTTIRYFYDQKNARRNLKTEPVDEETRAMLVNYFRDDAELTSNLIGRSLPWEEFHLSSSGTGDVDGGKSPF